MGVDFKLLLKLWSDYSDIMHIVMKNTQDFDTFSQIIDKIRKNHLDFSLQEQNDFILFMQILSRTIYDFKYYAIPYDIHAPQLPYDPTNNYINDSVLNYCYHIKSYFTIQYSILCTLYHSDQDIFVDSNSLCYILV